MTDRKKGKERLDGLIDNATEAEADPDRHRMEEAILATLAKGGPADPFNETFFRAFNNGSLTFSRSDLSAVANALHEVVCLQGVPADAVLLRDKLGSSVTVAVLTDILDGSRAVDAAVALLYIEKLNRLDKYRAADAAGRDYLKAIEKAKQEGGEVEGAFADLSRIVFDLAKEKKLLRDYPVERDAAEGFLDILNARRADGRDWLGLDSGFKHLNEILNGLTEGVFILAGAPSCGKTTLAKQIADIVAEKEKVPVLFYSFEQSAEELRIKSLARLSSVDSRVIWKGRTGTDTWAKVAKAAEEYLQGAGPCLTIIEAGRKDTVEAIRAAALMARRKAGDKPVLLILDYLQIIPAGKDAPDTLRERIDWNLTELRRLSRDLKSPVLVVSSQNREAYKENKPPTLAALKESGGIEYSADGVICLWRDKGESERLTKDFDRLTVRVEAHVLKNRNGELAKVKLDFTPAWALFTEGDKERLDYTAALGE
jgi:replicative DNA helicase